jgi:PhnB protein
MPTALHVHVKDADEVYRRAIDAGARSLNDVIEAHGERFGCVQDVAGNQWYIATRLSGQDVPDLLRSVTMFFHPAGAGRFIEFLKDAFAAEEILRHDSPDGAVLHAKIRIGDSVIETSEAREWWGPMPSMIMMYVPDVDSAFERASRADGAKTLAPITSQPYGRTGAIEDPFGNQWFLTTPPATE